MGLAQRRIVQEYQSSVFPGWKKQFDEVCGWEIPMEVRWETMQDDGRDNKDQYFQWYDAVYFRPLMAAFKELCSDKMGKDAVKAGVKKIIIDGTDGISYRSSTFDGGILTMMHKFDTNVESRNEQERAEGWKKLIEGKL